jgi:ABC-type nitrate/sulfonate/bicarbonate transport system substrate-binding protein
MNGDDAGDNSNMIMQPKPRIFATVIALLIGALGPSQAQTDRPQEATSMPSHRFKAAAEQGSFEWFFLLVDAGKDKGIWARNGLDPEFVPAAGSSAQLKSLIDSGVKIGFVNAAEVTLARSNGVPVKTVAAYFGETTARIFVAANGSIKTAKELNGKKIGIISATHTSYRTVLYINQKLGINAEPVSIGNLANNVAALNAGQIDALYSAEGAALTLIDSGDLRLVLPLADIYPKPYTAVVIWAADDLIEQNPDLVGKFVKATLEVVAYLKANPGYASELYVRRTSAAKNVAEKAVASLSQILTPSGRGSGNDLAAAVSGNWRFIIESGAVAAGPVVKIEEVVDARFLPGSSRSAR